MYLIIDSSIEPAGVLAFHWEANNYSLGKVIQMELIENKLAYVNHTIQLKKKYPGKKGNKV